MQWQYSVLKKNNHSITYALPSCIECMSYSTYSTKVHNNIIPSSWVLACTKLLHFPGTFERARTRNWYKVLPFSAVTSLVVLFPSSVSTHGCRLSWPTGWYSMTYFTMHPLWSSGGSQWTWTVLMDKGLACTFLGEEGPWVGDRKSEN